MIVAVAKVDLAAEALRSCQENVHTAKSNVSMLEETVAQAVVSVDNVLRVKGYGTVNGEGGFLFEGDVHDPQDVRNMQEGLMWISGTRMQRKKQREERGVRRNAARDVSLPQKEEQLAQGKEHLARLEVKLAEAQLRYDAAVKSLKNKDGVHMQAWNSVLAEAKGGQDSILLGMLILGAIVR